MTVELKLGGKYFSGWQSVRIERGIEQIAGTFELGVTDRWNTGQGQKSKDIKPGEACEVLISGQAVITGYVDTVGSRYDKQSHEISVSGRDKTGDLVDCSAIYKGGHWKNKKLEQIAGDLLAPFGIAVKVEADTGAAFPSFSIQEGESVFETLERAARMKAVLLVSDGLGGLAITRAGTARAPSGLTEGGNILKAEGEFSWKDRFSDYTAKGQAQGNEHHYAATVAHPAGSVKDSRITRYRPLTVVAEDQGSHATMRQRAEWERNVRKGRGNRATVTVQGWSAGGKDGIKSDYSPRLWQPNTLTRLFSPLLAADIDLLIVSVAYSLDESGSLTTLELAQPSAFDTLEGVKQTRLDKAIRKKQGDTSGITQPEWEW